MTTLISTASDGTRGDSDSLSPILSADGRYVAYSSVATNLVSNDTNYGCDAFVTDTLTGATTLVSAASDGTLGNGHSLATSMSSDGRYVAYSSLATNLVSGDTNGLQDVFVKDTWTNITTRVSTASNGSESDGNSTSASISSDGRYVAFISGATNLVSGDTSIDDVFVKDTWTNITTRVSNASNGADADNHSRNTSISSDGRYVAYSSFASNLVGNDTNGYLDIFVADTWTGTTTRVSTATGGTEGNGDCEVPILSSDGNYVAYRSYADNFVANDTNQFLDVFVTEISTGTTTRVGVASDGTQGNGYSDYASLSADGRYVAYASSVSNLVSGDTNSRRDIFVTDTQTGTTIRVSTASDGAQGNAGSQEPRISSDGRTVAYHSYASNLASGDSNGVADIFLASVDFAEPVFASAAVNGTSLVLTYSDGANLDAANLPAASAFSVSVGGSPVTVSSVAVNGSAKTVTLTLATAVTYGVAVTVSYTDLTAGDDANAIQDIFGHDAASLSGRTVTNNTPGSYDGGPSTPGTSSGDPSALSSAITQSSLGDTDKTAASDALQTFLASLPSGTPVTTSTVTPTSAPGGTVTISGTSATEAMVIDVSQLPPGTILVLENIEFAIIIGAAHVTGGSGSNYVIGDGGSQYIVLGVEDDTLMGGAGADTIGSASGRDSLMGGDDGDVVFGGEDGDTLYGNAGADAVYGNSGSDLLHGGQGNDWLFGGQDGDTLRGDKGVDVLYGDKGGDVLSGNTGDDWLLGGDGNDVLFGGQGNDWLAGEAGDDWLAGDLGSDTLSGGAGADRFYLASPNLGADVITDFASGTDAIVVKSPNFGSLPAGTLDSRYFALSGAETADSRFVFNSATGVLSYDADGSGALAGVAIAGLTNRTQLSANDLFVVA